MSHISAAVEYALHCLLYLIDLPEDVPPPSARDLAELRALPVKYVATIMTKLHKAGITSASEGVSGGIRLARNPSEISFLAVIEAVDGRKPLFDCRNVRHACVLFESIPPPWATAGVCSIHAVMLDAEARMRDVLRSKTLEDMAHAGRDRVPPAFKAQGYAWLIERGEARRKRKQTEHDVSPEDPSRGDAHVRT